MSLAQKVKFCDSEIKIRMWYSRLSIFYCLFGTTMVTLKIFYPPQSTHPTELHSALLILKSLLSFDKARKELVGEVE